MNHQKLNISLLIFLFISLFSSHASALLSESDRQLNKNIKFFVPIYCNAKTIPWEYWGKKYEFVITLADDEKASPKPPSNISNEFLGYKNKNTKLNLFCNKRDPISDRVLSSQLIETFDIDELSKSLVYLITDVGPQKKVKISISIARDMHNIEVVESRTTLKIFKTYKPTRIFNISFDIKDASETNTISSFSKDSVCYNFK